MCSEKAALLEKYKFKVEVHAHTSPASSCSEIPPEELVDNYKALGYDAVVITNHFFTKNLERLGFETWLDGYQRAKAHGDKVGLQVILGAEIRFDENDNDYLIYGVDEKELIRAEQYFAQGIDAFYKGFKTDRNVIFQAHPFRDRMEWVSPDSLDGIEVFNVHPNHNSRVGIAAKYAKENNLLPLCGTDYHHPNHQGLGALRMKALPQDSFELASFLLSGDYIFDIGGFIII